MATLSRAERLVPASPSRISGRTYWLATGALCLVFLVSVALELGDVTTSQRVTRELGFPGYFVVPLGIAKFAAVAVILSRRWRTLTTLAYAGLLYDLILALSAHIHERQAYGFVAATALAVWAAAFAAYLLRFPPTPLTPRR